MITVLTVIGARPQFVKAAMVSRALAAMNREKQPIREMLVHTGQHYDRDMSDVFFQELQIPAPTHQLGIGSGPHGQQTGRMLEALEGVMQETHPDCVMVYGDTNSTLAGALAASKLHIPVAHVEAGLRSFNRRMPEEINRVLVDHLATWLFCPTEQAVKNLQSEGIGADARFVGDVMAEALELSLPLAERESRVLGRLRLDAKGYILVTVHRAENTDQPDRLTGILRALAQLERPVVFPCHPRTRKMIEHFELERVIEASSVRLLEPVGYLDMLRLESQAQVILTDSGGVQKEAFWLGVPCVTLREETEWVETVEAGWNCLAGTESHRIVASVMSLLKLNGSERARSKGAAMGAAQSIIAVLLEGRVGSS